MKKLLFLVLMLFLVGCSTVEGKITHSANRVSNAVVRIECIYNDIDSSGRKIQAKSIGSGVIYKTFGINALGKREIDKNRKYLNYEYYVMTNRHVINQSEEISIYLAQFEQFVDAKLVGYDNKLDVAVLSFNYDKYIQRVNIASTGILKQGSFVYTIGNPDGYLDSLTLGVVSYPSRVISFDTNDDKLKDYVARYIQIDAAINPGSSGGGLFDCDGNLIGINTMKIVDEKIEGIGFAILIDEIIPILPYIEKGIIPSRVELGVVVNDITKVNIFENNYDYGMIITNIKQDSIAESIGLKVNDVIVEVNKHKIKSIDEIFLYVNSIILGENTKLQLKVYRNYDIVTIDAIL